MSDLVCIHRFYGCFDYFKVFQKQVAQLKVKVINVLNVLKRCIFDKNIVMSQSQSIATDAIVIVAQKKALGALFVRNGKPV